MNPGVDGDNIYQHRGVGPSADPCASSVPRAATSPTVAGVDADDANFQTDCDRLVALLEDDE